MGKERKETEETGEETVRAGQEHTGNKDRRSEKECARKTKAKAGVHSAMGSRSRPASCEVQIDLIARQFATRIRCRLQQTNQLSFPFLTKWLSLFSACA